MVTEHVNEAVRETITTTGLSLLAMLDGDLEEAWIAHYALPEGKKRDIVRGRIRGLAQAISTVRSPYTRSQQSGTTAKWGAVIKKTEDEAFARVKAQGRLEPPY